MGRCNIIKYGFFCGCNGSVFHEMSIFVRTESRSAPKCSPHPRERSRLRTVPEKKEVTMTHAPPTKFFENLTPEIVAGGDGAGDGGFDRA